MRLVTLTTSHRVIMSYLLTDNISFSGDLFKATIVLYFHLYNVRICKTILKKLVSSMIDRLDCIAVYSESRFVFYKKITSRASSLFSKWNLFFLQRS